MVCFIALIVFSILGIFSASNRVFAKEAFECVFLRVTFRPCRTGLKEKIKAHLLGKILSRSQKTAKFVNRFFEPLAWIFFILSIVSTFYAVKSVYNFYYYGNCNGLDQAGFCAFDPRGENSKISTNVDAPCYAKPPTTSDLTLKRSDLSVLFRKPHTTDLAASNIAKDQVVFLGCYLCDYTRKTYPVIKKLIEKYDVEYIFAHYPTKEPSKYLSDYAYCAYQGNRDEFWSWNDEMFASKKEDLIKPEYVQGLLKKRGYDLEEVKACVSSDQTKKAVDTQMRELIKTKIFGTPTIFINGKAVVGPKPERVYYHMLKGKLSIEL